MKFKKTFCEENINALESKEKDIMKVCVDIKQIAYIIRGSFVKEMLELF